jgi:uncharacterized repeat protein (TIGR03803 family)
MTIRAALIGATLVAPGGTTFAASFAKLVDFSFAPKGGANPASGVFFYKGGLIGTTAIGGGANVGSLYKYRPGKGSVVDQVTLLHNFRLQDELTDVTGPQSELAVAGNIVYGAAFSIGNMYNIFIPGIYSFDLATGVETILFSGAEGDQPSGVILVNNLLYGTNAVDDYNNDLNGDILSYNSVTGIQSVLYVFSGGANGGTPLGGVVNANGVLYGTTSTGGVNGAGTIFSFSPSGGKKGEGLFKTVYSFDPGTDGVAPHGRLTYANGLLFGTTFSGGTENAGGVFIFDPVSSKETTLHLFNGSSEGLNPVAPLLYDHRRLYGTTTNGGPGKGGTVFELDPNTGHIKVLHSFSGVDGADPVGALHTHKGMLYGTTYAGGAGGTGTIFKLAP